MFTEIVTLEIPHEHSTYPWENKIKGNKLFEIYYNDFILHFFRVTRGWCGMIAAHPFSSDNFGFNISAARGTRENVWYLYNPDDLISFIREFLDEIYRFYEKETLYPEELYHDDLYDYICT